MARELTKLPGYVRSVTVSNDGRFMVTTSQTADSTEHRRWAFCNMTNATGPDCDRTDAASCFGNGVAQYDGTCECSDPATGTGPTCTEFSNQQTCNDNGVAQYDGSMDMTKTDRPLEPGIGAWFM